MFELSLFAAIILLILLWYKFAYAPYQLFKRLGIPHPPVAPFFGNTLQLIEDDHTLKWMDRYGKVFGLYVGSAPRIVIADPDVLKDVMVKQFDCFADRKLSLLFYKTKPLQGLIDMKGTEWKSARTIVSQTFSPKKLKTVIPLIERVCNSLNEKFSEMFKEKHHQSVEVCKIFGQFTTECILAAGFGSQVRVLQGEGDELTKAVAGMFTNSAKLSYVFWCETILSHIPYLSILIDAVVPHIQVTTCYSHLSKITLKLIQMRKQQATESSKIKDYLDLLMEARADDNEDLSLSSKKMLTDEEIVGLCIELLLVGTETISNCLAYTSYLLALNTDIQEKLCQIIEDYYSENENPSLYEVSENIQYLDWVISESLRMYPPISNLVRECTKTCVINGITIPKGAYISIPVQKLHYCSEYWDQPDVFRPERFSLEEREDRHSFCYMPFGCGPRSCIGMRFAVVEIKMALISILREYKFHIVPETEIPLKMAVGINQYSTNGIYLKVTKH